MSGFKYDIITEIKKSDKSNVYLASVDTCDFPVIVKEIKHGDIHVFEALKEMDCEYLPKIYHVELIEDGLLVVEEYVDGELLADHLTIGKLAESECLNMANQICVALDMLHSHRPALIHRDIKPSNIIITPKGKVKLIDYDSSRLYKEESEEDTRHLGTEKYAPPEQYGFSQTDCRSDIYSLGVVFEKFTDFLSEPKQKLWKLLVEKCTLFSPDGRYQNISEVQRQLDKIRKCGWNRYKTIVMFIVIILMMSTPAAIYWISQNRNDSNTPESLVKVETTTEESSTVLTEASNGELTTAQIEDSTTDSTIAPTTEPTEAPTTRPTVAPTEPPTIRPTLAPTEAPTSRPTVVPTEAPTSRPTVAPTTAPTEAPTTKPTIAPTEEPTEEITEPPTEPDTEDPDILYLNSESDMWDLYYYDVLTKKHVIIRDGVTEIIPNLFTSSTILTDIEIPDSVQRIGEWAFTMCETIKEVSIGGVRYIDEKAFSFSGLVEVMNTENVEIIGYKAFYGCSNLVKIDLHEKLREIGAYAFSYCSGITDISIPEDVYYIGEYAFSDTGITSITIPSSLNSLEKGVFNLCTNLSSVIILPGIESIEEDCFCGCEKLTKIEIPETVTSIGWNAFFGCKNMEEITILGNNVWISPEAFLSCHNLKTFKGIAGSSVEQFAKDNGYEFVPIEYDYYPFRAMA